MTTYDISDFVVDTGPSNYARWDEPKKVWGRVVSYDLERGGKDFHDRECGHLDLEQSDGTVIQITIDDKRSLRNAITRREPEVGKMFGIFYEGKSKSNKSEYSWMRFSPLRLREEVAGGLPSVPDDAVVDDRPAEGGGDTDILDEVF